MHFIAEPAAGIVNTSMDACSSGEGLTAFSRGLSRRIGEQRYDLWFDRKTRVSLDGNAVIVEAGNAFAANWIRGKFGEEMREAAAEAWRRPVEICVRVGAEVAAAATAEMPRPVQADAAPRMAHATVTAATGGGGGGAVINPRYTLEEFVVGPATQLA